MIFFFLVNTWVVQLLHIKRQKSVMLMAGGRCVWLWLSFSSIPSLHTFSCSSFITASWDTLACARSTYSPCVSICTVSKYPSILPCTEHPSLFLSPSLSPSLSFYSSSSESAESAHIPAHSNEQWGGNWCNEFRTIFGLCPPSLRFSFCRRAFMQNICKFKLNLFMSFSSTASFPFKIKPAWSRSD